MKFTLDELIGHPTKKKTQKRKKESDGADAGKEGTTVINEAQTPLESTVKEVSGLPATKPKAGDPIRDVEATLPILMEIKVVEMALAVALLTLSTIIKEE